LAGIFFNTPEHPFLFDLPPSPEGKLGEELLKLAEKAV
jgi:hypothetical protein